MNAPATQGPPLVKPKQMVRKDTRIEPIPAISEPIARPEVIGTTRSCTNPNWVPLTTSTRSVSQPLADCGGTP